MKNKRQQKEKYEPFFLEYGTFLSYLTNDERIKYFETIKKLKNQRLNNYELNNPYRIE